MDLKDEAITSIMYPPRLDASPAQVFPASILVMPPY